MIQAAYGFGIRRQRGDKTLDVLYFYINTSSEEKKHFDHAFELIENLSSVSDHQISILPEQYKSTIRELRFNSNYFEADIVYISLDSIHQPIQHVEEAYFKLQLLSRRIVKPHALNLEKLFPTLHNIAWTNKGPVLVEDLEIEQLKACVTQEPILVTHVDKFPYMVNYCVPSGVRIASGSQVRLGAYLGEGTTVMPAGYINFNAGTQGNTMVEGRVSAGVFVDQDSDIGGGASIMGTLSGGNHHVISVGKRCLIGANAGIGISLGDDCTIAAGLYIYAGMKIALYNDKKEPTTLHNTVCKEGENVVKAMDLSGRSNMLFLKDSLNGKTTCRPNKHSIELNEELHKNG